MVAKVGESAANMATQGAIYNAASQIDENHLNGGNLEEGVEKALASTPNALATNALLGAAFPVAGMGLKLATAKASQAINKVATLVQETLPKLDEAIQNSSLISDEVKEATKGAFTPEGATARELKLKGITTEERDAMERKFGEALKETHSAVEDTVKKGFQELRPEETAQLAAKQPVQPINRRNKRYFGQHVFRNTTHAIRARYLL